MSKRPARLIWLAAILFTLALAACGGGDRRTAAGAWADTVCDAVAGLERSLQGLEDPPVGDFEAGRDATLDQIRTMGDAARDGAGAIRAIDPSLAPDVEARIAGALTALAGDLDAAHEALSTASDVDTADEASTEAAFAIISHLDEVAGALTDLPDDLDAAVDARDDGCGLF